MKKSTAFGELLKQLRETKGIGIKRLAPDLKVDYTYLSKLENHRVTPSEKVIGRIAKYFSYDKDELLLAADKLPEDVRRIFRENPREATEFLRRRFVNARGRTV